MCAAVTAVEREWVWWGKRRTHVTQVTLMRCNDGVDAGCVKRFRVGVKAAAGALSHRSPEEGMYEGELVGRR